MKPKLEILVGNIASGKSSYAQIKAAHGAIIINDDSVVKCIHEDQYHLYDEELKPLYKSVEHFIVRTALNMGKDVVINRTNQKRKTRLRFRDIGRECGAEIVVVKFPWNAPEIHAQRRVDHDGRGYGFNVWLEVAMRIAGTREAVLSEEYDKVVDYEHKKLNEYC